MVNDWDRIHMRFAPKGQPGTFSTGGVSCQTFTATPGSSGSSNGSPVNSSVMKEYAGNMGNPTGPGGKRYQPCCRPCRVGIRRCLLPAIVEASAVARGGRF